MWIGGMMLMFGWLPLVAIVSDNPVYSSYPTPPRNKNSLFYVQRSKNVNAIVYEANIKSDGTLDKEEPVKIYWIRYTSDSTRAPLTFIQNKYAYGIKSEPFT